MKMDWLLFALFDIIVLRIKMNNRNLTVVLIIMKLSSAILSNTC